MSTLANALGLIASLFIGIVIGVVLDIRGGIDGVIVALGTSGLYIGGYCVALRDVRKVTRARIDPDAQATVDRMLEDASPNFVPQAVHDLAARGFERVNNPELIRNCPDCHHRHPKDWAC